MNLEDYRGEPAASKNEAANAAAKIAFEALQNELGFIDDEEVKVREETCDYLQTYVDLLKSLCAEMVIDDPVYNYYSEENDTIGSYRCKVIVKKTAFKTFRPHKSQQEALEDCAGDAFKYLTFQRKQELLDG